jgi:3-methyladenine DNA glycosylase/8-oxoguanine DNA glycosylase
MRFHIATPRNFSFKRTAISHGWYDLVPFSLDRENWILSRVLHVGSDKPVLIKISAANGALDVNTSRALAKRAVREITGAVRHMLRLDDEIDDFYSSMSEHPEFRWIAASGAGRLLRSPTVFEDLVKTICTTNCSWALTDKMVTGLVNELGGESSDELRAFPTPEAMAAMPERFYRDRIRAGYRAPYLKELALRITRGDLDVESWATTDLPTAELKREMKSVKGVGDYAAENLLRLVGRYDCLALDSWVRGKFASMHNSGRKTSDKKIARFYARFGDWRGLALWCDMTRDWLESDEDGKW